MRWTPAKRRTTIDLFNRTDQTKSYDFTKGTVAKCGAKRSNLAPSDGRIPSMWHTVKGIHVIVFFDGMVLRLIH